MPNNLENDPVAFAKKFMGCEPWQQEVLRLIESGDRLGPIDMRALQKAEQRYWFKKYRHMQRGNACQDG